VGKLKTAYVCAECGAHSVKWAGQCPECAAWNTLAETRISSVSPVVPSGAETTTLGDLQLDPEERHATGFTEFDRVLGGGLVPGAVVLLGGDPGVGKSTLLQQVSGRIDEQVVVLYATGEESLRQISQRARRLGLESAALQVLADTSLESVLAEAGRTNARVIIIDSIQTMSVAELPSAPGSVAQLRESVGRLVQFAKQKDVAVFIIGLVT
jgi:DNA repair protein RadA/Sms